MSHVEFLEFDLNTLLIITDAYTYIKINKVHASVSCQFSDIGSHNQLSNEQKQSVSEQTRSVYPSKHICLCEMFYKEKYLSLEKVIPMEKFANHYKMVFSKRNGLQGWLYCWFL